MKVLCVGGPLDRQFVEVTPNDRGDPPIYHRVMKTPEKYGPRDGFETVDYRSHGWAAGDRVFWFYSSGLSQDQIMLALVRSYANADFQPEKR